MNWFECRKLAKLEAHAAGREVWAAEYERLFERIGHISIRQIERIAEAKEEAAHSRAMIAEIKSRVKP